ncbi:hypothetical protein FQN55_005710 [Onygenales sp. PD_40]|nr:hypothetical protein FQN55_005710 [Onygenales sp. PD_40]
MDIIITTYAPNTTAMNLPNLMGDWVPATVPQSPASFLKANSLLAAGLLVLLVFIYRRWRSAPRYHGIPRVRDGMNGRFSFKTWWAYYTDCEGLYKDAYETYLKRGQPCLFPGVGWRTEIILPNSALRWAASQPESILSLAELFRDLERLDWAKGNRGLIADSWLHFILKRHVNRNIDRFLGPLAEEMKDAVAKRFPKGVDEWEKLDLWETMKLVIGQVSSRLAVGRPLCRNEEYIRSSNKFVETFVNNAGIIPFIPLVFRHFLCPLIYLPVFYQTHKLQKFLNPIIKRRLECLSQHQQSPEMKEDPNGNDTIEGNEGPEPEDQLQMHLRYAQTERPRELEDIGSLSYRIIINNLGTMHQTTMMPTNAIFNILASNPEYDTINLLREEIASVLPRECYILPYLNSTSRISDTRPDSLWTKSTLSSLTLTDSVLRETLRLNGFFHRVVGRKVVHDNVQLPLEGGTSVHLPKGAMVSILGLGVHRDQDIYEDPMKFDPWRFARQQKNNENQQNDSFTSLSLTATSAHNLIFGYGRHACPGRFLADAKLKILLVLLLMNYDLALVGENGSVNGGGKRPSNQWIMEVSFPPTGRKGRILARRRSVGGNEEF